MVDTDVKLAALAAAANGGVHIWAHMHYAGWSLDKGLGSMITWVMVVAAFAGYFVNEWADGDL